MELTLYQIDAFADAVFKGNPAAVCPLTTWLPDEIMQKIAMENNLAETVYFVKEGSHYHIRWFTPTTEINLCGHATVAAAHVMHSYLGITDTHLSFTSKSGSLSVRKQNDLYVLNFPIDTILPVDVPAMAIEALGVAPKEAYKGISDYLLVYENETQLLDLVPNWNKLALVDTRGICVTAPGTTFDFVSRFFAPRFGINEDPVTGSAHTTLIPYWSKRLGKTKLLAKQVSSRGGVLYCTDLGNRTEIGGQAITYLKGTIFI